ncbi:hypothetical protein SO802_026880 [Lithocarpus litseifolius]|uniref:Uncharacterized protein n=1 Tax=Lithocarpus litseifolius TaxID=425828 RepID=A0AAW2C0T3_9ROSI
MTSCEGKNSWPELVGVQGTVAEATIERENPSVDAIIVEDGSGVTKDFRCDRVRVWVRTDGTVSKVPVIGKNSWPELVGVQGTVAEATIERKNPSVDAIIVEEGSVVPQDFRARCDRVRGRACT